MRRRFGPGLVVVLGVALSACGDDGGGDGGGSCRVVDEAVQGSCIVGVSCAEVRGGPEVAEGSEAECAASEGWWSPAACAESYKADGGCAFADEGMTLVVWAMGGSEADCRSEDGCWIDAGEDPGAGGSGGGGGGAGGSGGTDGGATCTTPDLGAVLVGRCWYADGPLCIEVRGEAAAAVESELSATCASESGVWTAEACPADESGSCVSGIDGATFRHVWPGSLWSEVWATCDLLDCAGYVE